jgi:hypothetical protein
MSPSLRSLSIVYCTYTIGASNLLAPNPGHSAIHSTDFACYDPARRLQSGATFNEYQQFAFAFMRHFMQTLSETSDG